MNPENMLKGRMAETLFEEMMRHSGNIIYRFGYEALVQNLTQLEEKFDRYSDVGEKIRAIPDFIVIDRKGKPVFVEVKFRWNPELHISDYKMLERIGRFWGPKVIFINCWQQPYFRVSNPPYISKSQKLVWRPLLDEDDWKISKSIYDEYERLVYKYLTPTLVPSKK
ncbi:MAG: hypothetical protein AAB911_01475 [Patescibacteria group bacterium]